MERLSGIVGIPVICVDNGKQAGKVREVVCAQSYNDIAGFCVSRINSDKTIGFILIEDILEIGRNAIFIRNDESVNKNKKSLKEFINNGKWPYVNKKVVTGDGTVLGTVKDGVFDEKTGRITKLEVSMGIFEDLKDGRKIIPMGSDTEFGNEFIIISNGGEGYADVRNR